ncbi:exo-beta-N-acetylmuramidase NamZ family protein [Thermodesulfatator atlanticus]
MVLTGLAKLVQNIPPDIAKRRVGLLCHQASVLPDFSSAPSVLKDILGKNLRLLFAPQHGFAAEKQANMVSSADTLHTETGLPLVSLYGPRLAPEPSHLAEIDVLLVDLQDVGVRVYTYIWTLFLTMKACAKADVEVVVLDRPNPIGGKIEGPLLQEEFFSFVGMARIPLRHGLTIGEIALYFKHILGIDVSLRVVTLEGWKRNMLFPETGLPWIPPSPNMPTFQTALLYPGMVLLEGTNLSEGRGTTTPFELLGAPWLNTKIVENLRKIPGLFIQKTSFIPWFDKWAGRLCQGLRLMVNDISCFEPVKAVLAILGEILKEHEEFAFRTPPYEYEWQKLPFDIIVGTNMVRELLVNGEINVLLQELDKGIDEYQEETRPIRLYV